ncbi:MAG: hypothetical protein DWQ42_17215 [Planctomycetota bacterium]|nr:MAG: hypothetical protein DWQ42_17215 [Planctomycetota bacterium]REK41090.1 MAG: hypothetical protein DWQ46_14710 [Planctomycetota bacterium]
MLRHLHQTGWLTSMTALGCLSLVGCAGTSDWLTTPLGESVTTVEPGQARLKSKAESPDSAAATLAARATASKSSSRRSKKSKSKASATAFAQQFSKARGLEAEKNYSEARAIYEQLITEYPERWQSYHRLAVVADRQRRHREAEALYAEALRLEPMNAELLGDLGYCYYLQGMLTKAESALAKAISIAPSEVRHHNNLGLVLGHQGKHAEALASFRRAGGEADAQYNLAFVLASQDQVEAAQKCFHAALIADPAHEAAHQALAAFQRYERTPEALRDDFAAMGDGRWVRFVEAGGESSGVVQASYSAPTSSSRSQTLQAQARQMMQTRLATTP